MDQLTLIPIGGLGNRLYAITSAIAFCEKYSKSLRIVWFRDAGMGAGFHSMFELTNISGNVEVIDAGWKEYIYDRPRRRNLGLPFILQLVLFDTRIYLKQVYDPEYDLIEKLRQGHNTYLVHYAAFFPVKDQLKYIRPVQAIRKRIDERISHFPSHVIGVHIRRTDHTRSIEKSPLSLFIDKMNDEISQNQDVKFYIASDSTEEKAKLKEIFSERIITIDKPVCRDTHEGILDAVTELYTLASTSGIYGSFYSSFSQLAADLYGRDLQILTKE